MAIIGIGKPDEIPENVQLPSDLQELQEISEKEIKNIIKKDIEPSAKFAHDRFTNSFAAIAIEIIKAIGGLISLPAEIILALIKLIEKIASIIFGTDPNNQIVRINSSGNIVLKSDLDRSTKQNSLTDEEKNSQILKAINDFNKEINIEDLELSKKLFIQFFIKNFLIQGKNNEN